MTTQKKWVQLLWWLGLYIFWVMVFQKREFTISRTATVEFCYLIFIAANFYFNIYFTIPKFLYKKEYVAFVGSMLVGIVFSAILRVPLATYLNQNYFLVGKPQPVFSELFTNSFINIFIWVICLVAGKITIDRFRFQQYLDEMAKEKERAELDFLNAQFNPHFLFNSINAIYGHIDKHNIVARNMLLTFSEMLRYQLYDCNNSYVAIDKEINYIKNYVAIQQIRKEESLKVNLNIAENLKGFGIAPLLFIAFIENAFKYVGDCEETENSISIEFEKGENHLIFSCFNTKAPHHIVSIAHKGIGIANAKRRLGLLYPQKHDLEIVDNEHFYEVILKLQLT